jgi:cellulose biosynthesis protein BcsQ
MRKNKAKAARKRSNKAGAGDDYADRLLALRKDIESSLTGKQQATLEELRRKSVAIASGKGGVGKTITAANLSIFFSRSGYRVALLDLDPLSDVSTVLDLTAPEPAGSPEEAQADDLPGYTLTVFRNLDLIFPAAKLRREERRRLAEKIYLRFLSSLNESYDLLIFDLPAGSEVDDNLVFLPYMSLLILVTNPEPTAHAAAGGYIKRVLDVYPETEIYLWHNRFQSRPTSGFDPSDVAGNYNRNVAADERLQNSQIARLIHFARVPEDPSLNLLQGNPPILLNIQRQLLDILRCLLVDRLPPYPNDEEISLRSFELVQYFISRSAPGEDLESYLDELGAYLRSLLGDAEADMASGSEFFTPRERAALLKYIRTVREDDLREQMQSVLELLQSRIERLERSGGDPSEHNTGRDKSLERELSSLLMELSRMSDDRKPLRNYSGLLLFYFSLYKLFQSRTIVGVLTDIIPHKKNSRGREVRDRYRQISYLVEGDKEYQKRYFALIRSLYPIVNKQISAVVKTFELSSLLFRNSKNELLRQAYLKLFINFVHDVIYSGLSVVVGFKYRSAAAAFREGAEKIRELLHLPQPGQD